MIHQWCVPLTQPCPKQTTFLRQVNATLCFTMQNDAVRKDYRTTQLMVAELLQMTASTVRWGGAGFSSRETWCCFLWPAVDAIRRVPRTFKLKRRQGWLTSSLFYHHPQRRTWRDLPNSMPRRWHSLGYGLIGSQSRCHFLCAIYRLSNLKHKISINRKESREWCWVCTLTATDNKILVRAAKWTTNHKLRLFLAEKSSNDIGGLDVDQLKLVVSQVDQYIPRISTDAKTGHFRLQLDVILFLPRHKVVDKYVPLGRYCDHSLAVWRNCAILYPVINRPTVWRTPVQSPEAKLGLSVEWSGNERFSIWRPARSRHWLIVMIDLQEACSGLPQESQLAFVRTLVHRENVHLRPKLWLCCLASMWLSACHLDSMQCKRQVPYALGESVGLGRYLCHIPQSCHLHRSRRVVYHCEKTPQHIPLLRFRSIRMRFEAEIGSDRTCGRWIEMATLRDCDTDTLRFGLVLSGQTEQLAGGPVSWLMARLSLQNLVSLRLLWKAKESY